MADDYSTINASTYIDPAYNISTATPYTDPSNVLSAFGYNFDTTGLNSSQLGSLNDVINKGGLRNDAFQSQLNDLAADPTRWNAAGVLNNIQNNNYAFGQNLADNIGTMQYGGQQQYLTPQMLQQMRQQQRANRTANSAQQWAQRAQPGQNVVPWAVKSLGMAQMPQQTQYQAPAMQQPQQQPQQNQNLGFTSPQFRVRSPQIGQQQLTPYSPLLGQGR